MRGATALAALAAGLTLAARAGEPEDLYRVRVSVTGMGEASRTLGIALAFEEVLIKVSGDPRLARDAPAQRLKTEAMRYVADYSFDDKRDGTPHRQQTVRDRPYDLTVAFDRAKIDAALATLGRKPWIGPRPRLLALVAIVDAGGRWILASDGERGLGQRMALEAVAAERGLAVVLPTTAALAPVGRDSTQLSQAADLLVRPGGGDFALVGSLAWSDAELGWFAEWQLSWRGGRHRWRLHGISFDEAFRSGVSGSAQLLSNNGAP